jgi:hypothetical protein
MSYKVVGWLLLLAAWSGFCYWQGGQGTRLEVATQQETIDAKLETKRANDETIVQKEGTTYAKATAAPIPDAVAPVVSVCYYRTAPAVPSARPAGSGAHEPAAVPNAGGGDPYLPAPTLIRWNTKPLVRIGRDADAQVAGLQDYINRVCLAKAP